MLETQNLSDQSQREGRSRKPGYHDDRVATVPCSRETMAAAAGQRLSFHSALAAKTLQDLKLTFSLRREQRTALKSFLQKKDVFVVLINDVVGAVAMTTSPSSLL